MEILVPISLGELYDKFSILEIKLLRIKDEEKLINIKTEYDKIKLIIDEYPIDDFYLFDLIHANTYLWELEELIRLKESLNEFDDSFILTSKNIYHTNDIRSDIKKQINIKYNSSIIEEKSYEQNA